MPDECHPHKGTSQLSLFSSVSFLQLTRPSFFPSAECLRPSNEDASRFSCCLGCLRVGVHLDFFLSPSSPFSFFHKLLTSLETSFSCRSEEASLPAPARRVRPQKPTRRVYVHLPASIVLGSSRSSLLNEFYLSSVYTPAFFLLIALSEFWGVTHVKPVCSPLSRSSLGIFRNSWQMCLMAEQYSS